MINATEPENAEVRSDLTRRLALQALFISVLAIAIGYAAAFRRAGTPTWAAWLLAIGIPVALGAIM
ncbi:MAG TPA: hypothetical protein VFP77_00155, partial [Gemmatimonadaceae bacterium]|nr:hypothetical protein [Gemmatimonadaceae bacterium]